MARHGFIEFDLSLLFPESRRFDSCQFAAVYALPNPILLIALAFVDAVNDFIAVLGVVLLLIDIPACPIQLMLDSRPLPSSKLAARSTRNGLIEPDLRLLSLKPRRLDSGQLAAANPLSNPLLLIVLTFVDAVVGVGSLSLRQAGRRDYGAHQRRHCKPFHRALHETSLSRSFEREALKSYALGALPDKTEVNRAQSGNVLLKTARPDVAV